MLNSVENVDTPIRYLGYPIIDIRYSEKDANKPIIKALNILYEYIYNSKEYMALQGKTQVLNVAVSEPELGLTTRIMHDMHVSQNAMKIASFLGLSVNEILKAKIMGIAHDIGHTPFGHVGEKVLDRELRRFGKGYSFSHAEYSENIFDKLFDECLERIKEIDIFDDDLGEYFESLKFSMKKGIRNHPEYYGYKDEKEGLAKKSVRLADTLSFMVTDLSDLMRAKKSNGEPILSEERILEELDKLGIDNKEYYEDVIKILKNGGGELAKLHEKVIEEAFSTNRRENITTIIDDYKFLQDINGTYERGDVLNNFKLITEYYNYLKKHKSIARENDEFFYVVSSVFDSKSEKEVFEQMRIIYNKIDKVQKGDEENLLSTEDMEVIKQISESVKDNIERQTRKIQRTEFEICPTLMMLFTMQDKIQYQEILGRNSEVLGNNEKQVEDRVRNRFQEVLKLAYAAYKNPEEYCINGVSIDLENYRGEAVPKNGLISYPPLDFATYAIQQMQNKDFDNENIVNEIAEKLGIKEEKRKEIDDIAINDIYIDAPRKISRPKPQNGILGGSGLYRVKKERYSYRDVKTLADNTIGINEENSFIVLLGVKKMLELKERTDKTKGRDDL